jgi:hypothetical protein
MPVMYYCKKCKQEVMPDTVCSICGQKLSENSQRLSWSFGLTPMHDFLCWNSILRVALPALILFMLVIMGVEFGSKGTAGLQALLAQGFWSLFFTLAAAMMAVAFVALTLRGRVEVRYILDGKGVHMQVWQVKPSLIKRILGMIPPEAYTDSNGQFEWMLEEKHIPWIKLCRVGFWPDRDKILLYSPRFYLALTLHALPETYDDAVRFVYEHVKKRPGVMQLPPAPSELPPPQL